MRPLLQALGAMAIVVWLLVLANLSSLQLVRAADRTREMAVRLALGARRRTILAQLLTESVVLAALGGAVGVVCALWAAGSLYHFLPRTYMPIAYSFGLDAGVFWAAVALSVATGALLGLAPAWQVMRLNQVDTLKEGGRAGSGARNRLRSAFVIAEIALAMLLLIAGGLAYRSFQYAQREDIGLDPNHVLLAGLRLEADGYDARTGRVFMRKLRQRLAEIPGVQAVAAVSWVPLGFEGGGSSSVRVEGYLESPGEDMNVGISAVSPGYFRTFRIPILEGRGFREADDATAPRVVVINAEVARRFFAGRNPIGAKIRVWGDEHTVVGVAKNGKYRSLNEPQRPFVYAVYQQHYDGHLGVALRVVGDPYAFVTQLRAALHDVDPAVDPFTLLSGNDYMGAAYLLPRLASHLLVGVSLVVLFLSVLGIYAVTAYAVSRRTRELGIRAALGATRLEICKLVLRGGLIMALGGVMIGVVLSFFVNRSMAEVLVGVTPNDPWTVAVAGIGLILVALAASWLPAQRASRVEPMQALRYE